MLAHRRKTSLKTPNNTKGKIGLSDGPCSSLGLVGRHGNERLYERQYL